MRVRYALPTIGGAIAIVLVIACVVLVLWQVPKIQVASLRNAKGVNAEDVFEAENDARATLAQIIGGFAVLIGLYFAWKNITAAKEGQVTERFTKAIEQLGATDDKGEPKLELRLGGIYALERIARDSERDHWPIMEILTAYVRKKGNWPELLATDIQAVLAVICRRAWSYEKSDQNLELYLADLHGADLKGAHLGGAILVSANLTNADLRDARLKGANLNGTHLEYAHLEGADLMGALGVTQEQINSAVGDATTKLPQGIVMPQSWTKQAS